MSITTVILSFMLLQSSNPLQDFVKTHFSRKPLVFISSNMKNLDDRLIFIFRMNQTKLITNAEKSPNLEEFDNFIIAEPNITALKSSINFLNVAVKTKGRFLVILQENVTEDESKSAFETLWHFYIYNAVLYSNWTKFVTWYPYHAPNTCGNVTHLVTITKSLNPYVNKIPETFNSCPISVTWDEQTLLIKNPADKTDPGSGIRVLETIAEKINANLIYMTENVKYMTPDIKMNKLLKKDMISRNIDLSFWMTSTPKAISREFQLTISHIEVYCYFVLPPRRKIISSTNMAAVFSSAIWSMILASVLLMAFLWKNLTKVSFETSVYKIVRLMLQCTIGRVPDGIFVRLVLGLFFFYVLNLNWIYVSQLSGVLSKPSYEPKILTIKQLGLSDKKLRYDNVWTYFFKHNKEENILKKHMEGSKIPTFYEELEDFVKNLDHGFIITNNRLFYIKNYQELHLVKEMIATIRSYLMVKRGFPFLDKINDVLLHIVESGLQTRWIWESQKNIKKIPIPDYYEYVEGHLDLDRILFAIALLTAGFLLSLIVFLLELLFKKLQTNKTIPT